MHSKNRHTARFFGTSLLMVLFAGFVFFEPLHHFVFDNHEIKNTDNQHVKFQIKADDCAVCDFQFYIFTNDIPIYEYWLSKPLVFASVSEYTAGYFTAFISYKKDRAPPII